MENKIFKHASSYERKALIVNHPSRSKTLIGIPTLDGTIILKKEDIIYVKASSNYSEVWTVDSKRIVVSKCLKVMCQSLNSSDFFRPHKSYLVNIKSVVKIGSSLVLKDGTEIPISRRKKNEVLSLFDELVDFV